MEAQLRLSGGEFDARRAAFFEEMDAFAQDPPNYDPVVGAFYAAALEAYGAIPAYKNLVDRYLATEPVDITSYQLNKFFKSHQFLLMGDKEREIYNYPENFGDRESWLEWMIDSLEDPDHPDYLKLDHTLQKRALQVNRYERWVVPAIAATLRHRADSSQNAPVIYEIGSAADLVPKAVAMKNLGILGSSRLVKIVNADGSENVDYTVAMAGDSAAAPFGHAMAIEVQPPKTPEDATFIKSCTFEPKSLDLHQIDVVGDEEVFDFLMRMNTPFITNVEGDFANLPASEAAKLEAKPADILNLSHVLSQNQRQTKRLMKAIIKYSKKNALLLATEYATIDPKNPQNLKVLDRWYEAPFLCKTSGLALNRLNEGWFPIFEWEKSNCEVGRVHPEGIQKVANSVLEP